ncbi:hypothetical protein ACN42_g10004 [Penicillium freii]|uniref:Uncharacterized protein n=1 Tax=Penicillium freii TaxID=48697 RepID=A0A101MAU2_PENFR|nr:hypothetical protein ACN42_g10004 [Penicillium freii]
MAEDVTLIVPMCPSVDTSNIHIGLLINLGYWGMSCELSINKGLFQDKYSIPWSDSDMPASRAGPCPFTYRAAGRPIHDCHSDIVGCMSKTQA